MRSARNASVFQFLSSDPSKVNSACVILHLREDSPEFVSVFFCQAVNKRHGLAMTFDTNGYENKLILTGDEETVSSNLTECHAVKNKDGQNCG